MLPLRTAGITCLALSCLGRIAFGQTGGPAAVPPAGVTLTPSGSPISATGLDWTFSNYSPSSYSQLFWGIDVTAPITADGTAAPVNLTYDAGASGSTLIRWTGAIVHTRFEGSHLIPVRLDVTPVSSGLTFIPAPPGIAAAGQVVDVLAAGSTFTVRVAFLADDPLVVGGFLGFSSILCDSSGPINPISTSATFGFYWDQVPNDDCSTAIPLSPGISVLTTNAAATTGPAPVPSCGGMTRDLWYSFVSGACGPYTVSTCLPGTSFDTVLAVWQGSCGALSEVACSNDGCSLPGLGSTSTVTFVAPVPGTTYWISVGGNGGAVGTLDLLVTAPAMTLSFLTPVAGSIGHAVTNGPPGGYSFTVVTLYPGLYPNGWFFGVDVGIPDILAQWSAGFPFVAPLGGPCLSDVTVGPFSPVPPGLTVYGVSLGLMTGSVVPSTVSNPAVGVVF